MTLSEVAGYLNISLNQVYKMSHAGRLPGKVAFGLVDKPRNIRVDRNKLDEFIAKQETNI